MHIPAPPHSDAAARLSTETALFRAAATSLRKHECSERLSRYGPQYFSAIVSCSLLNKSVDHAFHSGFLRPVTEP